MSVCQNGDASVGSLRDPQSMIPHDARFCALEGWSAPLCTGVPFLVGRTMNVRSSRVSAFGLALASLARWARVIWRSGVERGLPALF